MGVITRIIRMLEGKIEGYEHISRRSSEDEPMIFGTRMPVSYIVRGLEWCTRLDLIDPLLKVIDDSRITRPVIDEVVRYYQNNKPEIDQLIAESMARAGMIIKAGKVIRPPGNY